MEQRNFKGEIAADLAAHPTMMIFPAIALKASSCPAVVWVLG